MRRSQRTPKKPKKYLESSSDSKPNQTSPETPKAVAAKSRAEVALKHGKTHTEGGRDLHSKTHTGQKAACLRSNTEPKIVSNRGRRGTPTKAHPQTDMKKEVKKEVGFTSHDKADSPACNKNANTRSKHMHTRGDGPKKAAQSKAGPEPGTQLKVGQGEVKVEMVQCSTQTTDVGGQDCATQTELTSEGDLVAVHRLHPHMEVYIPVISDTGVKSLRRVKLMEADGIVYVADGMVSGVGATDKAQDVDRESKSSSGATEKDSKPLKTEGDGCSVSDTAQQLLLLGQSVTKPDLDQSATAVAEPSDNMSTGEPEVDDTEDTKEESTIDGGSGNHLYDEVKVENSNLALPVENGSKGLDKPVECPDCHRKFMTTKSMKNHQKIRCQKRAKGDRPYVCEKCGKGCITKDDLRKHGLTHEKVKVEESSSDEDDEEDNYDKDVKENAQTISCKTCGKAYKSEERLKKHERKHLEQKPYSCEMCPKTFKLKAALKNHMKSHDKSNPLDCDVCGKTFANAGCLKAHAGLHHEERPFQCGICGKGAGSLSNMKKHMLVHTRDRPFTCSYCGKAFQRKPALREHERIHTGEKPFQCTVCGKSFTLNNTLKMHMMRHNGERPYKCDICGKGFLNSFILRDHYRTHTGEKPYPCPVCQKMFTTKANLGAHVKLHSGQRPFSCSLCGKAFTSKAKMKMHEDSHSGKIQHHCPVCKKGFVRKDSLFSHLRVHRTDKTPSLCSVCGNKYSSPAALRVHFKKHLDIKPFECNICGKAFTRSDVWKKHLEWHMKHLDDIPGGQLEIIELAPDQEDVQIVVEEDVHIVVDQQDAEGKVEYVEIPLSELEQHQNAAIALAQHDGNTEVIVTEMVQDGAEVTL